MFGIGELVSYKRKTRKVLKDDRPNNSLYLSDAYEQVVIEVTEPKKVKRASDEQRSKYYQSLQE